MLFSAAKIPIALANAYAFHVSYTPPTAPPSKGEHLSTAAPMEAFISFLIRVFPTIKALGWVSAAAEAILIAGHYNPEIAKLAIKYFPSSFLLSPGSGGLYFSTASIIGTALLASSGLIRFLSYQEMKKFFTFRITLQKDHQLVKTGPYSFVRHPGYTSALMNVAGLGLWFGSSGSWLVESGVLSTFAGQAVVGSVALSWIVLHIGLVRRVPREDALLRERFTKEWDEWYSRVPYAIFPGIY